MLLKVFVFQFIFQIASIVIYQSPKQHDSIEEILLTDFKLHFSRDEIDPKLIRQLKRQRLTNLNLVNPGEEFKNTEIIVDGFPYKRLIFIAKSSGGINFIFYENGGEQLSNICIIYRKVNRNRFETEAFSVANSINTFEKLKDAIKNKNYSKFLNE